MPRNSSSRRRRRARTLAAATGVKYTQALRQCSTPATDSSEPAAGHMRLEVIRSWTHQVPGSFPEHMLRDPVRADVIAAARTAVLLLRALRSAPLRTSSANPVQWDGLPTPDPGRLHRELDWAITSARQWAAESVQNGQVDRRDAMRAYDMHGRTAVAAALAHGTLRFRARKADAAAERVFHLAEAVFKHGCTLGWGPNCIRRWSISECSDNPARVLLRIFDSEDDFLTSQGCYRHAAEEIAHWAPQAGWGDAAVHLVHGTAGDLDAITVLAHEIATVHSQFPRHATLDRYGWMRPL